MNWIDFFKKKVHADGQQVHEKIFNTANHQGNANQNYNEISPHTCQNGYYQKEHKQQMLARMYRKGNHHTLLVGMKIGATTMGNIMKTSQKLQIKLPYDIAIPLLGIHLKKTNLLIQKDTCTPNFHSSSIYKCQNMETTSMSLNRWMDKYVVCIYINMLLSRFSRVWLCATP